MAEPLEPRTFSTGDLADGDGLHALRRDQLAAWLLAAGIARPNESPDTFELTDCGRQVARETAELGF